MTQGFFQFNNSIINEINNFSTSSFDLLFVSGEKGVLKSEMIEKAIAELAEDNLVFRQFCFQNTVIDDFLLNFYDSLRDFSLAQKISLKKFVTDNFKEKVSHYFNTIQMKCIVFVENFENVDKNSEIVDFLSYLASYENVKIVIVTRNGEVNLFRMKDIKIKELELEPISKEDFKSKLVVLSEPVSEEIQEKFYEATKGLELYLKMALKYSNVTEFSINDLLDEFERKQKAFNVDFEEFMVSKFVTLTPKTYKTAFKVMCTLSYPVGKEFLEFYKIVDTKDTVEYLSKNFLVSFFGDEVYVKDYFRKHITDAFSIQEKVAYYTNLIEIYENELTKSPKDRLIRLSRESIRKEIEHIKTLIPSINAQKASNAFSYLGIATNSWQDEKARQKAKLSEKLSKIKERRNFLIKNGSSKEESKETNDEKETIKQENREDITKLLNSARNYIREFNYNGSITELMRAKEIDTTGEFRIEILILLGKNYEILNDYQNAQKCYKQALDFAIEEKDERKAEIEYLIADSNQSLYKMNEAKVQFLQIVLNETNSAKYRRMSHIALGEIYEAEQNSAEAVKHYLEAVNLSIGKDKQIICKAYYRLAVLYDENGDIDNAIKYYQKNYTTSAEIKENKYYSASLANLALIYTENSRYKEAVDCLKLALNFDTENNDFENLYFTQKELAKLYTISDENTALNYYKQALSTAKHLKDVFKVALVYFEVGGYYYDKFEDEKALVNFLNAKILLKNSTDKENINRINSRIQDIKVRMDNMAFNLIMEKYEKARKN